MSENNNKTTTHKKDETFESDRAKFMKELKDSDPVWFEQMSQTHGKTTGGRPASECRAPKK